MIIRKWLLGTLAVAAIAFSLFRLFHTPVEKSEQLGKNASEALGMRTAEEVAQLLGNKGGIALFELELRPGQAATAVAAVETFRNTLKKHGITVARTKAIPGGVSRLVVGGRIPRNDYAGVVESSPAVDAVVSFAGLPDFSAEELRQFQTSHPPLVVVDIFGVLKGPALSALVDEKTVALAFVPFGAAEAQEHANEPKIFEHYYRILRPASK